jgi:polyisoprenoid-binding protein YceI
MGGPSVVTSGDVAPANATQPLEVNPAENALATDVAGSAASAGIQSGALVLSPENTKIEFVGTHVGDKPDPRTGGFEKFTGKLEVDVAAKTVKSVVIDIDTASLWTQFPKLTDHLKSPDFFEVREYPTIRFESTGIDGDGEGQHQITGKLTLHGVTKEISVPATVQIGQQGPTLRSEFSINRSEFEMKWGPDRVEDKVALTVVVGEKTQPRRQ